MTTLIQGMLWLHYSVGDDECYYSSPTRAFFEFMVVCEGCGVGMCSDVAFVLCINVR